MVENQTAIAESSSQQTLELVLDLQARLKELIKTYTENEENVKKAQDEAKKAEDEAMKAEEVGSDDDNYTETCLQGTIRSWDISSEWCPIFLSFTADLATCSGWRKQNVLF